MWSRDRDRDRDHHVILELLDDAEYFTIVFRENNRIFESNVQADFINEFQILCPGKFLNR